MNTALQVFTIHENDAIGNEGDRIAFREMVETKTEDVGDMVTLPPFMNSSSAASGVSDLRIGGGSINFAPSNNALLIVGGLSVLGLVFWLKLRK